MRRLLLFVCLSLVLASSAIAQVGSMRVSVPSPTAATLGKFGDIPVSLYTGVPQISITLFTAQGRELSLPITLEYHASGIRVEEIGGWAGIGWTLEAGGAITRTVRGLSDDGPSGYLSTGYTWYVGNNWTAPDVAIGQNLEAELLDGEPDEYFFNFAGRSGQFVVGPTTAGGAIEARAIPHQKLRIERSSDFDIQSWTITTEDGTKYIFAAPEVHRDFSLESSGAIPPHYGQGYNSSWYLTEIRSPGGDNITLQYVGFPARHKVGRYQEKFDFVQTGGGGGSCRPPMSEVYNEYEIDGLKLQSITTAAHVIRFFTTLRTDALNAIGGAPQEPRLDKMTVETRGGVLLRQFQFTHDYSTGRLTLLSVAEQDRNGVSLPPYTFTYNSQPLPDLNSFSQDHWGFFNGAINPNYLVPRMSFQGMVLDGANRDPNPGAMQVGMLTRITYPTGGFNEFVYEPNDFGGIGPTAEMPIGPGPGMSAGVSSGAGGSTGTTTFTVGGTKPILVEVIASQDPGGCDFQIYPPCPATEIVGAGGGVYWNQSSYQVRYIELPPGTYTMNAYAAYPEVPDAPGWSSITIYWQTMAPVKKKVAGGLRVKEVRTSDGMGGSVQVEQYQYVLASDPLRSSGVIPTEPRYAYWFSTPYCAFLSRSSASKMPLGGGPVVGYREVAVVHGASGQFGQSTHQFRSVIDAGDAVAENWPFLRATTFEYMRGQEIGATELNDAGQKQNRSSQVYTFETAAQQRFRGLSFVVYKDQWGAGMFVVNPFEVISAWQFVSEDTTTLYNETGVDSLKNVRSYTYGNAAHLQLTQMVETNSNGTQRITRMKYPADYPAQTGTVEANAISAMQGAAHIHNAVIERWVLEKTGGVERVVEGAITTFKEYAIGQYRPYQRFVLSSPSPLQ